MISSRRSGGTGLPARASIRFTALSISQRSTASPFTRASTAGSCAGNGFTGCGDAAGAGGVAAEAAGEDGAAAAGAAAAGGAAVVLDRLHALSAATHIKRIAAAYRASGKVMNVPSYQGGPGTLSRP